MPRLFLIRHGEPAAGWGDADDPGLSEKGLGQAQVAARTLYEAGVRAAITSPLLRCRETAAPFAQLVGAPALVEAAIAEIPTPADVEDRTAWLRRTMSGAWANAPSHHAWRAAVVAALVKPRRDDLAVFSHFVAINVALGAALGEDAVTIFRPAHCSISTFEAADGALQLIALGAQATTQVT